jgi:hypothetical protein
MRASDLRAGACLGSILYLHLLAYQVSGQSSPGGTITTSRPYLIDSQVVDIQVNTNTLEHKGREFGVKASIQTPISMFSCCLQSLFSTIN